MTVLRPDVVIAAFQYRHEAEFAAGFLTDAGIPFRLQVDDAGGADAGMTVSNPARIWVRAGDEQNARELLEVDDDAGGNAVQEHVDALTEEEAPAIGTFIRAPDSSAVVVRQDASPARSDTAATLCGIERGVAAVLAVLAGALAAAVGPTLGASLGTALWVGMLAVLAVAFGVSALLGRSWGPFRAILRSLSGVAP